MSAPEATQAVPTLATAHDALTAAHAYAELIADTAGDRDRIGGVPWAELAALDRSGLLGITVPAQYGGGELPPSVLAEVIRIIAEADPAIAQVPQGHYLFVDVIALWGSEALRWEMFAKILGGARLGNALSERGGQHAQDLQTRLMRSGDGYRITGRKYYCTGAVSSDFIAVSALDEDQRLSIAVVDRHDRGIAAGEDWSAMGQRATVSGTTELTDVAVPSSRVFDYSQAFERPQLLGARAQLVHAAIEVGIAGGALRDTREFVVSRGRPFFEAVRGGWGERAVDDPHTVLRFGRLDTQLRAAQELLRWAAEVLTAIGLEPADEEQAAHGSLAVARAKAFGSETAVLIASDLFAMTGASGTDERHDLNRHWRNARTHSVHDPVDWKYHHIGAHALTGVAPPNHGQL